MFRGGYSTAGKAKEVDSKSRPLVGRPASQWSLYLKRYLLLKVNYFFENTFGHWWEDLHHNDGCIWEEICCWKWISFLTLTIHLTIVKIVFKKIYHLRDWIVKLVCLEIFAWQNKSDWTTTTKIYCRTYMTQKGVLTHYHHPSTVICRSESARLEYC